MHLLQQIRDSCANPAKTDMFLEGSSVNRFFPEQVKCRVAQDILVPVVEKIQVEPPNTHN